METAQEIQNKLNKPLGLKQPLTDVHMKDDDDFKNHYNPWRESANAVQVSKAGQKKGPKDLVPAPSDK